MLHTNSISAVVLGGNKNTGEYWIQSRSSSIMISITCGEPNCDMTVILVVAIDP